MHKKTREGKRVISIAIVEDDAADLARLTECLRQYQQEHSLHFSVRAFSHPSDFLDTYRSDFDLIFLYIELPVFSGIEVAQELRKIDTVVTLVFVTNMEQYAVNGYEVDALDFVVKPINYYRFSSMLGKALTRIARREEKEIIVSGGSSMTRLPVSQIYYVEIRDHLLVYHTEHGSFEAWGKLTELEAELSDHNFARCSNSHLVNLRHVVSILGNDVDVAGTKLPISQRRRKSFYASVTSYLSGK